MITWLELSEHILKKIIAQSGLFGATAFGLSTYIGMAYYYRISRRIKLYGKRVLITGAAMGIGKEMCQQFLNRGCTIIMWDIQKSLIDEFAAKVNDRNISDQLRAYPIYCNIADRDSVRQAAIQTRQAVGDVDVVINNAGIVTGKHITELTDKDITKTIGVNYLGMCFTVLEFVNDMIKRGSGHIVNVSSIMGMMWSTGLSDYCSSKYAAVGFTHCLRLELQKATGSAVTTSLICPFAIRTGMFDGIKTNFQLLFPMLEAPYVAERIVTAVEYREEVVIIPKSVEWINAIIPLLPVWLQDFIVGQCGGMHGMDNFIGRM